MADAVTLPTGVRRGVLDASIISDLQELDAQGGEVPELVALFLAHAAAGVVELRRGVERGDTALVADTCHRLQGSSATFGASAMSGMFVEIHGAVSSAAVGAPLDLLRRLEAELVRVECALTAAFPAAAGPAVERALSTGRHGTRR